MTSSYTAVANVSLGGLLGHVVERKLSLVTDTSWQSLISCNIAISLTSQFVIGYQLTGLNVTEYTASHCC